MRSLKVKRLTMDATLPTKAHEDDLGWDLYAAHDAPLKIGEVCLVHTDIAIEFPYDTGGIVKDRSSMALRGIYTSGGVIDCGYRGEIGVMLTNTAVNSPSVTIKKGQKIAQLVLVPVLAADVEDVTRLGKFRKRRGRIWEHRSMIEPVKYASGDLAIRAVNQTAKLVALNDDTNEREYVRLGWMLLEVAEMSYWKVMHKSFREYVDSIAQISKRSTPQLLQYFYTVRDLSSVFNIDQLKTIGITKAIKLRQAKGYCIVLPDVLTNAALEPQVTPKELRKLISTTLKVPEDDSGDWMSLDFEFYVTPDERKTLEDAIAAAMRVDPQSSRQ